ncbi:MAG: polysaccharide biosynthesis/export family protein, partial [Candidatus Omnitrophica bacterium]|nr:polysaccharide biosynthesis/export family protein [Candidatus Omnitrophota bacterium]
MEKLRGINMVFLPLSIKRVARLAFLSAVILTLAPFNSSAQNFADFNPDSESIDGTIPDDVIEELLAQEDRATIALDIKEDLPNSADESTYTLGVNDVIQINVMRHPEVSGEFRINSEGKIQYEFVGDIVIQG